MTLSIFSTALFLCSCEKNDIIADVSDPQGFTSNVFFSPLTPVAFADTEVECEIEYWSLGDEFQELSLLQRVIALEEYEVQLTDVDYVYIAEISSDDALGEDEDPVRDEVRTFQHDFTNWVPDKTAYVLKFDYYVEPSLAKAILTEDNTAISDLTQEMSELAVADFYDDLSRNLDKSELQIILVDVHAVATQNELNGYYDAADNLTSDGRSSVISKLQQIGLNTLIGAEYELEKSNLVVLNFQIINGYDEESISTSRSFNVN